MGFFVYRHLGLLGCNIAIMKRFLPLFILTGLLFGQDGSRKDSSKGWSGSFSFGVSSEKIPISFYNYSLLYDNDEHSELFGTFTSIIFVSGIGLGYKYYIMGKSKSSMFISICALNYFADDFSSGIFGFSTAAGVSLRRIGGKTSFNIGISRGSLNHPEYPILPFINLEKRR